MSTEGGGATCSAKYGGASASSAARSSLLCAISMPPCATSSAKRSGRNRRFIEVRERAAAQSSTDEAPRPDGGRCPVAPRGDREGSEPSENRRRPARQASS